MKYKNKFELLHLFSRWKHNMVTYKTKMHIVQILCFLSIATDCASIRCLVWSDQSPTNGFASIGLFK